MIAEHAGSGERQSARMSHACGALPASFANGRAGSNRTHQPSCTNSSAEQIFHATSSEDAGARASGAQEPRVDVPERGQHAGDEDGFRDAIQRDAVEWSADAIRPEQRARGQKSPERIH